MNLSIGIVGLPNVGKSTLYNALTKNQAEASNYPFCTIEPNVGIVEVPDRRLEKLSKVIPTQKIVPAIVKFVDIAGIVKGASVGEGLGNKFLSNIKETDAIAEVVRFFNDENIVHVSGKIDPTSDMETIKTELILADLETLAKKIQKAEKDAKGNPKLKDTLERLKKIYEKLEKGESAHEFLSDEKDFEAIADLNLLSAKPHLYVFNVDEKTLQDSKKLKEITEEMTQKNLNFVIISAKIESELNELTPEEKDEYLHDLGQEETGLSRLIKKGYEMLGLATYFTAGEKEIKAWTIKKGWTAPQAAGVIHTDFQRGFIKTEVIGWKELVEYNGWQGAKNFGKIRLEGKDYIVSDGDVMIFKFNV